MATFKICLNCCDKVGLRRRKCINRFCRGDMFRAPTDAEVREQETKDTAAHQLLKELLECHR